MGDHTHHPGPNSELKRHKAAESTRMEKKTQIGSCGLGTVLSPAQIGMTSPVKQNLKNIESILRRNSVFGSCVASSNHRNLVMS